MSVDLKNASVHPEAVVTFPPGLYHVAGQPVRFHKTVEATVPQPAHEAVTAYIADVQGVNRRTTPTKLDGTVDMAAVVREAAAAGAAAAIEQFKAEHKPEPAKAEGKK